jgi:hypothetical protein
MNEAMLKERGLATFTEIGDACGVSHEQARRDYYRAVKKVRKIAGPIGAERIRALLSHVDQNRPAEITLYSTPIEVG